MSTVKTAKSVADEVALIQGAIGRPAESGVAQPSQLDTLAKLDDALRQMGIPLVEPYQRPLSTRTRATR